jgi:hypothetical protein
MSDAQDAARYRWLRKNRPMAAAWILPVDAPMPEPEDEMDSAIDAAMREDAAKSERAAENYDAKE